MVHWKIFNNFCIKRDHLLNHSLKLFKQPPIISYKNWEMQRHAFIYERIISSRFVYYTGMWMKLYVCIYAIELHHSFANEFFSTSEILWFRNQKWEISSFAFDISYQKVTQIFYDWKFIRNESYHVICVLILD